MINYGYGVSLRPISDIDPETLRGWRNDADIYKWCRQHSPLEKWEHKAWVDSLQSGRKDVKMFSVFNPDQEPAGVCGLTDIDLINRRAEFSLYIATNHWGQGFGAKALRTLTRYGFHVLGLNHIFGETFDQNPAAHLFESLGFRHEGTRRGYYFRDGKFIDAHLYSMLASEFKK